MTTRLQLVFVALAALVSVDAWGAPNIVVIMTDDQALESVRVLQKTRNLIGGAGTTFKNYYTGYPLCCPSRATFLTGQHAHNHGVLDNVPPIGGYTKLNHQNTLPLWLQEAGYYTAHIGKYLNGYGTSTPATLVPPGWNDWQGLVLKESAPTYYNYQLNDNGKIIEYGESAADYQTDVLADRAVQTIGEAAQLGRPFFLNIATLAPHPESTGGTFPNPRPAPRDLGAFDDEPLPKPPSFDELDVSDKPAAIRNLPRLTSTVIRKITARYRSQLGSLLAVDDLVQRVIDKLKSAGVLNNTVVVFTSDNGYFHGQHRIPTEKRKVYDEASKVPLLARGPGFTAGKKVGTIVSNVDLAPTIVALAGAQARLQMDGRSLLQPLSTRAVLIESTEYHAVRDKGFVYVEHDTGEKELYDLRPGNANYDPFQLQSRHAAQSYASIRTNLKNKLDKLRNCSGASCIVQ
jgi:arylsulfatase A-like enzyme